MWDGYITYDFFIREASLVAFARPTSHDHHARIDPAEKPDNETSFQDGKLSETFQRQRHTNDNQYLGSNGAPNPRKNREVFTDGKVAEWFRQFVDQQCLMLLLTLHSQNPDTPMKTVKDQLH